MIYALFCFILLALNTVQGVVLYRLLSGGYRTPATPVPFAATPYTDPDVVAAIQAATGRPVNPDEPPLPLGM